MKGDLLDAKTLYRLSQSASDTSIGFSTRFLSVHFPNRNNNDLSALSNSLFSTRDT